MKIAIIGGGAMGSLLAAKLPPLAPVWLVSSWAEHRQAINRHGLRLTELDGAERTVAVAAVDSPAGVAGKVDLALICVKSRQTEAAGERAAALLNPDGLALTLQNGLGNAERLAAALGAGRVVQGVTSHGATLVGPGHVRHAGAGATHLAVRPGLTRRLEAVRQLFEQAGFETHLSANLDSLVWGKLVINVGINALTAILRTSNGALVEVEPARVLMSAAVAEAVAVAQAKGISLPYLNPQAQVEQVARATAANRSSMLSDVIRAAPTEIEVINGAVVKAGEQLGLPTPVNRLLAQLVRAIEATYSSGSK
ncbi:MAG: ketopantoate reductase family protein [Anaerolineae bacterium]